MTLADLCRPDFPILSRLINGKPLAYLDSAASSQKPRQVIDAVRRYYETSHANVHRSIHTLGEEATALLEGARDSDGETRLYCLWGLAHRGAAGAEPIFREGMRDSDPSVRSVSAYGLGSLQGPGGMEELKSALKDPVEDVRWNVALALGRRGDSAGGEVLISLLDRKYLDRFKLMDSREKSATILSSLIALKRLKLKGLDERIAALARSDPDPAVREAARSWESTARP